MVSGMKVHIVADRHSFLLRLISICIAHPFRLLLCIATLWPSAAHSDLLFSDDQIIAVVNAVRSGQCDVTCSLGESRFYKFNAERISGPHGAQHWLIYLIREGWCGSAGCGSMLIAFGDTEVRVVKNAFGIDSNAVSMSDYSSPESLAALKTIPMPINYKPGLGNEPTSDESKFIANIKTISLPPKRQKLCPYLLICSDDARLAIGAVPVLSLKAENEFTRGNLCETATFAAATKAAGNLVMSGAFSTLFTSLLYETVDNLFSPFTYGTRVLIGGASKLALGLVVDSTFGALDYSDIPKDTFKELTSGTIGYMAPKLTEKYVDQSLAALAITEATKGLSDKLLDSLLNQENIVRANAEANNTGAATPSVDAKIGLIYNEETHYVTMLVRSVGRNRQECGEKLYVLKYEINDHALPVTSVEVPHEELPVRTVYRQ